MTILCLIAIISKFDVPHNKKDTYLLTTDKRPFLE